MHTEKSVKPFRRASAATEQAAAQKTQTNAWPEAHAAFTRELHRPKESKLHKSTGTAGWLPRARAANVT
jgi:hypothetical protein